MFAFLLAVIYVSFISLGLPDSLLGAAWPTIYPEFGVPVSYAGIVSMIISVGTIVSSLLSDRLTRKFGAGLVTAVSVTTTALALLGFSLSTNFWTLILFAIPYGLGAGGVDASLNNYVALHLKSHHMSWLHCMWGLGASVSPYIMGYALTKGNGWEQGYFIVFSIQIVLSALLFISLPIWKKSVKNKPVNSQEGGQVCDETQNKPLSVKEILRVPGAVPCFIAFFCYCALEQTAILWGSSYMVLHNGISTETAANYASLFLIGITVGRAINGFLTMKFGDKTLIRMGLSIVFVGIVLMLLPLEPIFTLVGFLLIGLGCAPVYPSIIHMTPSLFGADKSQAMIGVQMASAYLGSCLMPPLFGLLANHVSASLLPFYLFAILALMIFMHETVVRKTKRKL